MSKQELSFQHKLKMSAVTGHVEKAGQEDGDVGVSVTVTGGVKLSDLVPLIACAHTVALLEGGYNAEGDPVSKNIDSVKLNVSHEDVIAHLNIGAQRNKFKDATVDSLTLTPQLSRVIEIKARLKVNPTEAQAGWLLKNLGRDAILIVEGGKTVISAETTGDSRQPNLSLPDRKDVAGAKAGKKKPH